MAFTFTCFFINRVSSTIVSFYLIKVLRIKLNFVVLFGTSPKFRNILSAHWGYGRWVSGSAVVHWLSGSVYLPMVGFIVGLSQLGARRRYRNLVLRLDQIMTAIGMLLLPWFAMRIEINGKFWLKRRILKVIYSFSLVALLYISLMLFCRSNFTILYGENNCEHNWMIPYFCLIALVGTKNQLLYIFLKSFQKSNVIFISQTMCSGFLFNLWTILMAIKTAWKLTFIINFAP